MNLVNVCSKDTKALLASGQCAVLIDVTRADRSSAIQWKHAWYAANTVYWMCVKQGKGGTVSNIGTLFSLLPGEGKRMLNDTYLKAS